MAKIDQALLERLETKLGVGKRQVYAGIEKVANKLMLDRHLAALVFASEHGVNVHRYSTSEERAAIRGSLGKGDPQLPKAQDTPALPTRPSRSRMGKKSSSKKKAKDNSVFVVHGRNEPLRKSTFEFLRALGLQPLEWSKALLMAKGANPYIGDVLDSAMQRVQAVVVLFSPDDEARLKEQFCSKEEKRTEGSLQGQPRPNVIFEAGLALGRHPEKTLLIQVGKVRGFTDIAGKHVVRLSNDVRTRTDVANRLQKIGCEIDRQGTDWIDAGDFTA